MGKSVKKPAAPAVVAPAAPAVVAPPAAVPKVKALRKREAEDEIEKAVSAKKQKAAPAKAVPVPKKAAKKAKKQPPPKKAESGSSDEVSSESEEVMVQPKKAAKPVKQESSDDISYESFDEEPAMFPSAKPVEPAASNAFKKGKQESYSQHEAKTPINQNQALRTKTLLVGNLPYAVDDDDVKHFFSGVVDAVNVRLVEHDDGQPKGFGYVDFATAEDADKALVLNGQKLMDRAIRVDRAAEKAASTRITRDDQTSAKPSGGSSFSVYVKGLDKSEQRDDIESSLYKHFSKCGEITRVYVPMDHEGVNIKGIAFVDFSKELSLKEALGLTRSSLGGCVLHVEEAKSKGAYGGGRWSGGRVGGGRFGGRDGGRRGGRGFQSRPSAGKKIIFDND